MEYPSRGATSRSNSRQPAKLVGHGLPNADCIAVWPKIARSPMMYLTALHVTNAEHSKHKLDDRFVEQ